MENNKNNSAQKLEIELLFDPGISLLGTSLMVQNHYTENMYSYIHCSTIIHDRQNLNTTQMPMDRLFNKESVVNLHIEYYSIARKTKFMKFVYTWIKRVFCCVK